MIAHAKPEPEVVSRPCCWSVDRDGFAICTVRRDLRRAVEGWTGAARAVRLPAQRDYAIGKKNEAIRELAAHTCDRAPVVPSVDDTSRGPTASPAASVGSAGGTLASIMADVATLVALGRRATMPDSIAEYDAAYHALESKIARALPKPFTERLEGK